MSNERKWIESPSHCDLYLNFAYAYNPFNRNQHYLEEQLGEAPSRFVERLVTDGLIEICSLEDRLASKFKVSDLKELLKERGLKLTGKRAELIERLIAFNFEEATTLVSDVKKFTWTEAGKMVGKDIILARAARVEAVKTALEVGDFTSARRIAGETASILPITIEDIWDARPTILSNMSDQELNTLRSAVGTGLLLGKGEFEKFLPEGYDANHQIEGWAACSILVSSIIQKRNLESFRKIGIRKVKIIAAIRDGQCCPNCRELHESEYPIDNAPELPHRECVSPRGCHCQYVMPEGAVETALEEALRKL